MFTASWRSRGNAPEASDRSRAAVNAVASRSMPAIAALNALVDAFHLWLVSALSIAGR